MRFYYQVLIKKEIEEIMEKEGKIEVRCHFCDRIYEFSLDDIKNWNLMKGDGRFWRGQGSI